MYLNLLQALKRSQGMSLLCEYRTYDLFGGYYPPSKTACSRLFYLLQFERDIILHSKDVYKDFGGEVQNACDLAIYNLEIFMSLLLDTIKPKVGFLYLAHSAGPVYKIGKSRNPYKRVKTLGLKLVHKIESNYYHQAERILHSCYAEKKRGEYFDLSYGEVQEICAIRYMNIDFTVSNHRHYKTNPDHFVKIMASDPYWVFNGIDMSEDMVKVWNGV